MEYIIINGELYHHGTKGMRWGIRRYQNKDGSLTPAGKRRYAKELDKLKAEQKVLKTKQRTEAKLKKLDDMREAIDQGNKDINARAAERNAANKKSGMIKELKDAREEKKALKQELKAKEDADKPITATKKSAKEMTDAELSSAIARMQLEKQYKQLVSEANPQQVDKGKSFVSTVGKEVISPVALDLGRQILKSVSTMGVNAVLKKLDVDDEYRVHTNNKKK